VMMLILKNSLNIYEWDYFYSMVSYNLLTLLTIQLNTDI